MKRSGIGIVIGIILVIFIVSLQNQDNSKGNPKPDNSIEYPKVNQNSGEIQFDDIKEITSDSADSL